MFETKLILFSVLVLLILNPDYLPGLMFATLSLFSENEEFLNEVEETPAASLSLLLLSPQLEEENPESSSIISLIGFV